MEEAIRQRVIVPPGGHIEFDVPELCDGGEAEVIVLVRREQGTRSYRSFLGVGKGRGFATPEEADAFLRQERDSWDI